MSCREMSHFSAIISAERNWLTSWSPYRVCQPGDSANGVEKPYCWPTIIAAEIGMALMFCTPPATTRSWVPDMTPCAAKCTACWEEPHWRSMVTPGTWSGRPGDEPGRAGDVARLGADGVAAAEDHVVDGARVDTGATHQCRQRVRGEVGRVHLGQRSPRLPTGVRTASMMKASGMGDPV